MLFFMSRETSLERALRLAGSITELSRLCGVSRQTVHNWINGKTSPLTDYRLRDALAKLGERAA